MATEEDSAELKEMLKNVNGLWDIPDLARFLHLSPQAIYDYRYRKLIESSVFVRVGKKLRINPWRAVDLALKGELIKTDKEN